MLREKHGECPHLSAAQIIAEKKELAAKQDRVTRSGSADPNAKANAKAKAKAKAKANLAMPCVQNVPEITAVRECRKNATLWMSKG